VASLARTGSCHQIAHQISVTAPNIKLMVTLRNPVDRAYSGFEMDQQHTRNRIENAHGKKALVKGAWYDAAIPSAKAFAKILKVCGCCVD